MPFVWVIVWLGVSLIILALIFADMAVATSLLQASGILISFSLLIALLSRGRFCAIPWPTKGLLDSCKNDPIAVMATDTNGVITHINPAARSIFGDIAGESMILALADLVENPVNFIFRLQRKARVGGAGAEIVTTDAKPLRFAVHQIDGQGFIWRLEYLNPTVPVLPDYDEAVSLPMLVASPDNEVLAMNAAMVTLVGSQVTHLDRLFHDLPLHPAGPHRICGLRGDISVRVIIMVRPDGEQEIHLQPCDPGETSVAGAAAFLEELDVALVNIDSNGKVLKSNRLARRLLGHPMNGEVFLRELIRGLGRSVNGWVRDAMDGRGLKKPEVVQATLAEGDTYLQITLNRIEQDGDMSLVAVLSDATELKTLEAQFVQSQKMQAIGQLAGGVAHDFNNLLTAISGYCDLLLLRHDVGDQDYSDLMQISQNANRAASLVGQLLAFSRKQNLQPEILDLRDTLSNLSHLLNRLLGETVLLSVENTSTPALIMADKRQLEQVIMNLVVNARDAMPNGGTVRVTTTNIDLNAPLYRDRVTVPKGAYVSIIVSDSGTGIPADIQSKIFEPFFTTKPVGEGTGLGLSTAYGIVKQSGGYIFVDSTPGVGTEFSLMFPAHERPAKTFTLEPEILPPVQANTDDGVILLVEDEVPVRTFAARALRMHGYTVLEAGNAEEALEYLADSNLEIDVFVTDVIMPGMDGPTWVRKALEQRPNVKVVFVSGYAEDALAEHRQKIPNSVFLPKPFSLNELTSKVREQIQ